MQHRVSIKERVLAALALIGLLSWGAADALPLEAETHNETGPFRAVVFWEASETAGLAFQTADIAATLTAWENAARPMYVIESIFPDTLDIPGRPVWGADGVVLHAAATWPSDSYSFGMSSNVTGPMASEQRFTLSQSTTSVIPEPATGVLCALGLAGFFLRRRF